MSEKRVCSLLFLTVTQPRNLKYLKSSMPIDGQQLKDATAFRSLEPFS